MVTRSTQIQGLALATMLAITFGGCGQSGKTEFVIGDQPSTGLGSYVRESVIESPYGLEFAWASAAPCPGGELIILAGDNAGTAPQAWITKVVSLEEDVTWHVMPAPFQGMKDAAIHCTDETIFVVGLVHAEPLVGRLISMSQSSWPLFLDAETKTFDVPAQSFAPSIDWTNNQLNTVVAVAESNGIVAYRYRFENNMPTYIEESQTLDNFSIVQRDLSWRSMRRSDGTLITVLTGYGETAEISSSLWLSLNQAPPIPLDYNESMATQQLLRWKNRFWIIGTRLRPTVPLGLVFAVQRDTIPTLREIH